MFRLLDNLLLSKLKGKFLIQIILTRITEFGTLEIF